MNKKSKKEQAEQVAGQDEHIAENTSEVENNEQNESHIDELGKLEQENAQLKDSLLRKAAELDNVKKRVQRERIALFEDAKVASIEDFLPIYDDLLRVIDASADTDVNTSFLTGIKLVTNKFNDVFKKYHIEPIDKIDVPFDVDLHDALLRQPASKEDTPSNTVIQILERGYKMGSKTISHAKVIVSE